MTMRTPPFKTHPLAASAASLSFALLGACALPTESEPADEMGLEADVEEVGRDESALYGTTYTTEGFWATGSCSDFDAIIHRAMNVGRFVAKTDEFRQCVAKHYRRCDLDKYPFSEPGAVIMASQMPNDTVIRCAALGGDRLGRVSDGILGIGSDMHDLTYKGAEQIALDRGFLAEWKAADARRDPAALYRIAAVIWHEALHVYGFSHGHNSDAAKAKSECGRNGDASWDWRNNSAPYAVQNCILGAIAKGGEAAGWTGTSPGKSLVKATFERTKKRMYPGQEEQILSRIAGGTYTPADLKREALRNGSWGSATPTWLGASHLDELTGSGDVAYYVIDVPTKMDLRVKVTSRPQNHTMPDPDVVGPLPEVVLEPYYARDPVPTRIGQSTSGSTSTSTFTVWPSRFYIKVHNASAFTSLDITVEEAKTLFTVNPNPTPVPRPIRLF
jgi:hypothetical protein